MNSFNPIKTMSSKRSRSIGVSRVRRSRVTRSKGRSTEDHQQFFTPSSVAKEVADLAVKYGPPGATYLESCAGDGAILEHLPKEKRMANELDPKMCGILRKKFPDTQVRCRDFLTYRTKVPRSKLVIATNPPYRGGWRQSTGKDLMWGIIRHGMTLPIRGSSSCRPGHGACVRPPAT